MKNDIEKLGERITKIRLHLGFKQKEFAKELDIHPAYLSQIEKGYNINVGVAFFKRIADKYKVSLEYLIRGEGEMFTSYVKMRKIPDKGTINNIHSVEDMIWLMDNCNLYKNLLLAEGTRIFFEHERSIKQSLERCKSEKEGKD